MRVLALVSLVFILAFSCFGQTFGTITGEVRDSSGAVVPGATVTVTNTGTNAVRTGNTNAEGLYTFPSLPPGIYDVKVEVMGFRTATRSKIELQVQQTARIDFKMEVGQVAETIEVAASAAMLTTENASVGTVIDNRRIVELPLNGRNFLQLVSLSPNVSYGFGTPGQAEGRQGGTRASQNISIAGQRGTWNHYTLDGVENTDVNFNLYVLLPSTEALQEFKVQSGIYSAEFGRGASQINVSTKAGTNEYHGSMFEFLRNSQLDARQYDFIGTTPVKNPFRWNQYGYTLGGPVAIPGIVNGRDRLFFMTNFEGHRERRTTNGTYTTPTVAMRNGDFSQLSKQLLDPSSKVPFAGNQIPVSRFDPVSIKLMEFWPEPNIAKSVISDNYQKTNKNSIDKDQFTVRLDFNENSTSQWFGRFSWTDESTSNEGIKLNGTNLYTNAKQYMISNTRVLSPTLVNEFRFGINSFFNGITRELSNKRDVVGELGIPGLVTADSQSWGIPRITSLSGYSGFGDDSSGPFTINNAIFQAVDNFSYIRGRHSIRFGGEVRRDRYNQKGNEFARGSFEFRGIYSGDSAADLFMGALTRAEATIALAFAQYRSTSFGAYIDDTWRVSPTVTINMGLRYELVPPFWDRSKNLVNAHAPYILEAMNVQDPSLHPVLVRTGTGDFYEGLDFRYPGVPVARDGRLGDRLIKTDYSNWAPRLGIAYNPDPKWSIRTGVGMFYSVESFNSRFDMNRGLSGRVTRDGSNELWTIRYDNFMTEAAMPWQLPPAPFLWAVKDNVRNTYSIQYLLNIQREITPNTIVEFGYNGAISRHLQGLQDTNQALPGPGSIQSRRPFPEFGTIQTVHSEGNGRYDGLGFKFTRRYTAGFTYMASYTWSKALDDASAIRGTGNDIFPQNSYCLSCDRGYSAFNTPHRFVTSVLYELPFGKGKPFVNSGGPLAYIVGGWQLGSIITIQSGRPVNLTAGSYNSSGTNHFGEIRMSSNGQNPYLPSSQRSTEAWIDKTAVFPASRGPVLYEFGNISRNRLMGPTQFAWDFSSHKNFAVMEGHELQFRFEAFNFPNHPSLGSFNGDFGSSNFGKIRGTSSRMREMQFALKYVF